MEGDLVTVPEAAAMKGVSQSAIYTAVSEGRLPAQRVPRRIALRRADVEAYEPINYRGRPGVPSRGGRPRGSTISAEARAKISEGQKRRWVRLKGESPA